MGALGSLRMSNSNQRLLEQLLKIRLSDVDDVVDVCRSAVAWMIRETILAARRPQRTVGAFREDAVLEITAEQPELPELIRDVFADVGDDTVGPDDDLLTLLGVLFVPRCRLADRQLGVGSWGVGSCFQLFLYRHHPAAREATLSTQVNGARGFQHLEGLRPEFQSKDVAFPSQQVVVDVHPRHG